MASGFAGGRGDVRTCRRAGVRVHYAACFAWPSVCLADAHRHRGLWLDASANPPAYVPTSLSAGDHPPADAAGFEAFVRSLDCSCTASMLEVCSKGDRGCLQVGVLCLLCGGSHCSTPPTCSMLLPTARHADLAVPAAGAPLLCLQGAEPLGHVAPLRGTHNVRRLYEDADVPEGLVVMGDAVCGLDPFSDKDGGGAAGGGAAGGGDARPAGAAGGGGGRRRARCAARVSQRETGLRRGRRVCGNARLHCCARCARC